MADTLVTVDETNKGNTKGEERTWSELLPELLCSIRSSLFAGDSIIFGAVCKSWQLIPFPQPLLMPIHDSLSIQSPCLMFFSRKNYVFNFFDPIRTATYQVDIPKLVDADIRFSKDGWLIMCQGRQTIFLFNPLTKEKIELPDIPECTAFTTVCFSNPPTSSNCQVFGIQSYSHHSVTIGILKVGEEVWTVDDVENNCNFKVTDCSPVMCNGLYYCLGFAGNFGVFDPEDNSWTICGKRHRQLKRSEQRFLIESDGDLFAVFASRDGRQACVLKLDFLDKAWHEVQSLGDRMLYVCYRGSFSKKAVVRGTSNKIYFPKFFDSNGVFYSLTTRKFHTFFGNYSRGDFYGTKEMKHCAWINPMPSMRM
ncbi:unnamed protein product [Ilex paraguariensis]|uniref:KIB1-4 beta-propeller domain-containing protein n=1 Tax=Ilex paraguariensis TaxID=185542 RepID=A0ABC8SRZ5_9AQUA